MCHIVLRYRGISQFSPPHLPLTFCMTHVPVQANLYNTLPPHRQASRTLCSRRATSVVHHTLLSSAPRRERDESCNLSRLHSGKPGYTSCNHSWRQGVRGYMGHDSPAKHIAFMPWAQKALKQQTYGFLTTHSQNGR